MQIELSLQSCALQKLYFGDPRSHVTSKSTWFRARECFHLEFTRFQISSFYASQLLDDGWLTWWCSWHDDVADMMVEIPAMTFVRDLEVFWLNFLWQTTNQRTNERTNERTYEHTTQPADRPSNQPTDQQTNQPTHRPTNRQTKRPTNRSTNQPANQPIKKTDKQTDERTNAPTNKCTERKKDR